jgi:hypothetical protein
MVADHPCPGHRRAKPSRAQDPGARRRQAMSLPDRVEIVEVGMRDGLQIESEFVPTDTKIQILNALIDAGVRHF